MNNTFKSFVLKLLFFTVILALVSVFCFYVLDKSYFVNNVFLMLPFYFLVTTVSFYIIFKTYKKSFSKFTNSFMLVTSSKLIVLLFFLLVYVMFNRSQAVVFIVWYFLFYLAFTIFEVLHLLKFDKNNKL